MEKKPNYRTIREVCELTGVTRRALQEYEKKGIELVRHTTVNESGYWLYDEETVEKIKLIKGFSAAGLTRKQIKAIIEDPNTDILGEVDKSIQKLEEQRKILETQIMTLRDISLFANLPFVVKEALTFESLIKLKTLSLTYSNETDWDNREIIGKTFPFIYAIIAIGCLQDYAPDSPKVFICVEELLHIIAQESGMRMNLDSVEAERLVFDNINSFPLLDIDSKNENRFLCELLEYTVGPGTLDFVKNSLKMYAEYYKNSKKEM